jgi:hypothetical protein
MYLDPFAKVTTFLKCMFITLDFFFNFVCSWIQIIELS